MANTRTASEYRSASIRLWELAAGSTTSGSHDAFADLAVVYETLADQEEAAESAAVSAPQMTDCASCGAASASNVLHFVARSTP
jgi:hypothetical protein